MLAGGWMEADFYPIVRVAEGVQRGSFGSKPGVERSPASNEAAHHAKTRSPIAAQWYAQAAANGFSSELPVGAWRCAGRTMSMKARRAAGTCRWPG